MNSRHNAHYMLTHEKIQSAFLNLAAKSKEVTVGQLCTEAGINRSTFYQHYGGFGALLDEIYLTRFAGLSELFYTDPDPDARVPLSFRSFQIICRHIYENRDFYRIFLGMQKSFPISTGFSRLWEETFLPYYRSLGLSDEAVMLHRFVCVQTAFTNTVTYWLEGGCTISVDDISTILSECISM